MSSAAHEYDEALLAAAPEIDKKQRQEGYSTDLLDQSKPDKHHSTAASPGAAGTSSPPTPSRDRDRDVEHGAPPRSRTGSTTGAATPAPAVLAPSPLKPAKSRPFFKTKKGLLIIAAVLAAIIVAAVVGGVVGSRNARNNNNSEAAAPAETTTQQSGSDDGNSQGGSEQDQQGVGGDGAAGAETGTPLSGQATSTPPFPGIPTGPPGEVEQQPSVSGLPPVRRRLVKRRIVAGLD